MYEHLSHLAEKLIKAYNDASALPRDNEYDITAYTSINTVFLLMSKVLSNRMPQASYTNDLVPDIEEWINLLTGITTDLDLFFWYVATDIWPFYLAIEMSILVRSLFYISQCSD